ncbi:hypothetical protein PLESTB_000526800 [Pleodorina starrii]|uniref:Uncharacterized protein n=1 Tax=Pleodorina starrii TaxID=330485 RepID=A0A9W6BHL4_9CHLO|nr:hypothetical protein PLESTM_000390200 [Pleodorina starrii]GLC51666.1 hypothetical protein PLESTB_000526800 [Pleodorina starrii]GLC72434.1 hypothetical protein PLESTF_001247100 [Pleodorina starrii]
MARQRRLLQIARRMLPLTGKGIASPTEWEKKKDQINRLIYRKHGIPNAVQLGHTSTAQASLGYKERVNIGIPMAWPGLPALTPVGASRGGIIEVCSPGQLCRDVAAQMALAEARSGSVLWMAVGPHAAGFVSSVLRQVPNLTLQQRDIGCAADCRAALQELLWLVRQQTYSMVILDGVAGLAPPPAGLAAWGAVPPAPYLAQARAEAAAAAAATVAAAQAGAGPWGPAAACTAAAADLVGKLGTAAAARVVAAAAQGCHGSLVSNWSPETVVHDSRAPAPVNLKFLQNVLPVLLEETLAELAASCGPELRTTTLLLNAYTWRERGQAAGGAAGPAPGGVGGHGRWARRAILRHAAATLHLLPEVAGPAAGEAAGEHGPARCLRAVLSRGGPSGEDGDPLRTWSLMMPIRLASPPPADG